MVRRLGIAVGILALLLLLLLGVFRGCQSNDPGQIRWRGLESGYQHDSDG
jgi:hypothetical protein